ATIENAVELEEKIDAYEKDEIKNVLILVIDARIGHQRQHIPFARQLIDKSEKTCNVHYQTPNGVPQEQQKFMRKYFIMLLHLPAQELYNQSCFPSIFLQDWNFYFFDTCTLSSAFHLQKLLDILCQSSYSKIQQQSDQQLDDNIQLYDLNILFDDCLWEFCSRLQLVIQELPKNLFKNDIVFEFYQKQTSVIKRVQCFKQILSKCSQLQKRIMDIYHEHLLIEKQSCKKIYNLIYQISKDILCGKRFDGLVDS
ncbi:unnamed protein product, partial [Didymodactylos carnosus]